MVHAIQKIVRTTDAAVARVYLSLFREQNALITFLFHSLFRDEREIALNRVDPLQRTTVAKFRQFIEYYLRHGYRFVTPADLLAGLRPDLLFCNADEAQVLGLADRLPSWAPELVLVHAGARPTRVVTRHDVLEVPVAPLDEVRDTTGCGDAFAAGVLARWRAGAPVGEAVRAGHAAAAVVAGVLGALPPR